MATPNVAFTRKLRKGDQGRDVIAHKRAVSRAFPELYPWPKKGFSGYFGIHFENAVRASCVVMNIKPRKVIDLDYHEHLERRRRRRKKSEWAFDAYSIKLAKDYHDYYQQRRVRERIVEAAFFWYGRRSEIHYSQNRPYQKKKPPQVPSVWDCSSFVTNCYYASGASDPNNRNYDGSGYTGTLLSNGIKIPFSKIEPADLIMYGYTVTARPGFPVGSPTHVAIYVGEGRVLSLGSYPMGYYEYSYRSINCCVTYDFLED